MKNYWKFMLAAFAVLAAVSCAKQVMTDPDEKLENQETVVDGNLVPMSITVGSEGTKTDIADNLKSVVWCEDDKIAVFDAAGEIREFTVQPGSINGGTAVFEGAVLEGTTDYYAVYPYSAAVSCADGKVVATTMTEQVLEGGKVADGAIVAVGKSKVGQALQFKNVVGVMRMDLTYDDVTEIILDGAALAGTATFDPATGEIEEGTLASASNSVTLKPAGDVFAPGSYFVPLLPGTTAKDGFHMAMVRAEDKGAVHTATEDVAIPRNGGFFVQDTKLTESFVIKDAQSLQTFLTKAKDYKAEQLATIVRDIDLTGVTLTPASDFAGVLNGAGHSLKNWTTNGPLFTKTSAGSVVKDFVLDASCNLNMKETDDKQAFVVATNAGNVSGITNKADIDYTRADVLQSRVYGTIVGYSTGLVSDCHNEGDITLNLTKLEYTPSGDGEKSQNQRIGGVVGAFAVAEGTVGVTGCTNSGDLTVNFYGVTNDDLRPHFALGGVCGLLANDAGPKESSQAANLGTISNCTNYGQVKLYQEGINGSNFSNVGGVIGYLEGTILDCVNAETGAVTLQLKNELTYKVSAPAVGGVVGTALKGNILNCSNAAPVYITGYVQAGANDAPYSGGNERSAIGGIVAKAGAKAEDTSLMIKDCKNTGTVSGTVWNSNYINMGGIVGWTSVPVVGSAANTLENSGKVELKSSTTFKEAYVGGVIGRSISTFNTIYNTGAISVAQKSTTTVQKGYIGGVAGYMEKAADNTFKQGNNKGAISLTGGKSDGKEEYMVGGIVGKSLATKVTSNGTSWVLCHSNYGDITVNSPVKVYVGGILGSIGAKSSGDGNTTQCKNRGNITVKSPVSGSCIGGVIGEHGRGMLGNANNVGSSDDPVTISVETDLNDVYVGGYVGRVASTNGPTYPSCSSTISGFGFYGDVNAPKATAGLIAGNVTFAGATTTNGLMIAQKGQPVRIAKANKLNGVAVGNLTAEGACLEYFIATITPSEKTTKTKSDGTPLKGIYYICANGDTSKEAVFPYGFVNY